MDIKDLNKSQLILLALLLSFVTSIATGIVTVTLMDQAPESVSTPITKVIRQTIERAVSEEPNANSALTKEQEKLLEDLKSIKPLEVSLFLKEADSDKFLGSGIFLGENKVVMNTKFNEIKEGEVYVIKSLLGEKKVKKISPYETFSIVELEIIQEKEDVVVEEEKVDPNTGNQTDQISN